MQAAGGDERVDVEQNLVLRHARKNAVGRELVEAGLRELGRARAAQYGGEHPLAEATAHARGTRENLPHGQRLFVAQLARLGDGDRVGVACRRVPTLFPARERLRRLAPAAHARLAGQLLFEVERDGHVLHQKLVEVARGFERRQGFAARC